MSDFPASGRLEDHPFPYLAGTIFRESRTGALSLESGGRSRTVWFLGGNPVAVVSAHPQDHLAHFLLEHGRISEEDAARLEQLPETREGLAAADFIAKDAVNWGVKFRFVNLCYDLFRWEQGAFAFREENPPRELYLLKVPSHSLIFKGVGYASRAMLLESVPDSAVFGAGPVTPEEARYLGPGERKVLEECQPGRTVGELLSGGWDDPEQVRQTLYALLCLGLITLGAPAAAGAGLQLEAEEEPAGEGDYAGFTLDEPAAAAPPAPAEPPAFTLPETETAPAGEFRLPPLEGLTEGLPAGAAGGAGAAGPLPFESRDSVGAFDMFSSEGLSGAGGAAGTGADRAGRKGATAKKSARAGSGLQRIARVVGIALGAVAALAVVGGVAWWWLGGEAPLAPVKPPVRKSAPPPPQASRPQPAQPAPAVPAPPSAPNAPAPAAAPTAAPAQALPAAALPAAPAPAARPASATPAGGSAAERYRSGLEVFRGGDVDGAAVIWEDLLAGPNRGDFTVQLLTACQKDTIRDAQRSLAPQDIYLVTRTVNGRRCFRVCLGVWGTREEAGRVLAGLPAEFKAAGAAVRPVADVLAR